jgi:hypothetical protein
MHPAHLTHTQRSIHSRTFCAFYRVSPLLLPCLAGSVWSLISIDPGRFASPRLSSPARWTGAGSPYLLHLLYAAHVIQPHLVAEVHAACRARAMPTTPVLVGACAWYAHAEVPIDTDDLDFVLVGSTDDDVKHILEAAVVAATAQVEVRHDQQSPDCSCLNFCSFTRVYPMKCD